MSMEFRRDVMRVTHEDLRHCTRCIQPSHLRPSCQAGQVVESAAQLTVGKLDALDVNRIIVVMIYETHQLDQKLQ